MIVQRQRWRWPLRRRLVLLMLAMVVMVVVIGVVSTLLAVHLTLLGEVDDGLQDAQTTMLAQYPFTDAGSGISTDLTVKVVDSAGRTVRVLQRQTRVGGDAPSTTGIVRAIQAGHAVTDGSSNAYWRILAHALPDGTWLAVAQQLTGAQRISAQVTVIELGAGLAILLGTALLTMRLLGYGLRPLTDIAHTASRIEAGDLSRRHPVSSHDEVGQLAAALNSMLDKIEASFKERQAVEERLRQFVDDAGHELRTPVTAIHGWADLYRRGGVSDENLPTAMRRIQDEAGRMAVLVDELLLLASLDKHTEAARQPVDLAEVVRDAVLDARAVEPDRPLTSEVPPAGVAVVDGDPAAFHQVVANLLANVRVHTPAATPVHIQVQRVNHAGGDRVVLRVADQGPGVPPELREHIFDRFFRADSGRTRRGTSGAGLGLSIVAAIIAKHHGEVCAEPVTTGFTVRVSLPAGGATTRAHPPTRSQHREHVAPSRPAAG